MAALAVAAILGGLEIASGIEKINAAEEQEEATNEALRERMTQERIEGAQKATARDQALSNLIGHQMATEAVSGFDLNSPSFNAITMDDYNKFSQSRSNDALELKLNENQLQQDMAQNEIATNASIWGTVVGTAASIASQNGFVTNLSGATAGKKAQMVTPEGQKDFDDETSNAQQRRKKSPGLFDNIE